METIVSKSILFTTRSENLARYFVDVNHIKPLPQTALEPLFERAANGDARARNTIITQHLKLVVSVAKRYEHISTLSLEDLINEGNIGLMVGLEKFDRTKGVQFTTVAVIYIREYILRAVNEVGRIVHYPKNMVKENYKSVSTDEPLGSDENGDTTTLLDTLDFATAENDGMSNHDAKVIVSALLAKVRRQKDREIICDLFGIGTKELHQRAVAAKYDCTEEAIRQLKFRTLLEMQKMLDVIENY